ncbi:hypothetical protein DSC45_34590 [Streptomyces sp. YIM 130001]|uniref:SMI1/KNR4 family protein n=1 Tax=Streptomyces sp. YIM 130001 TaxID=2259644 RepID=UPI000E65BD24|nr:SMI1/KNR4 family protein [Streptomyces sp. YIM 130001]RII06958.1 hypothetical protein DSC45_34590 [Streptomyces sp. YIM 130001]
MAVEVPAEIEQRCIELGDGVRYALRVLCRQLDDDPLMGSPAGDPSLYVTEIDGEVFEDCPALIVTYAYGPPALSEGQLRITAVQTSQTPIEHTLQLPDPGPDPRAQALQAGRVVEAWQRFTSALRERAPASYALLRSGTSESVIQSLEATLGVRIPADLKALWRLNAGVQEHPMASFLPERWALMELDTVIKAHQVHMGFQREWSDDLPPQWRPSWIPFASWSVTDTSHGLYLDGDSGEVCRWTRFGDRDPEQPSLTVYLEDTADALDTPALATHPKPGLINGFLQWGPRDDPEERALWAPLT